MPSIATMLGRWFWWPQVVYPRGDYQFLPYVPKRRSSDADTEALPAQG
jgi:RND superfamily putative drug exporter